MDQSRDKRIMALVRECAELDAEERAGLLDAECNGDGELRSAVEALLAEDGQATGAYLGPQHLKKALPDHYRLIDMIGSGGMAEVFLAEDTRLKRKVAIKFLNDAFRRDPERMKRFNQEARSASALNHPNIITIHDIGEQDGIQYIVSEYVDGETLASRMTRGRLSISEAVDVAIKTASALDVSHRAGIIHRDLKPENIMLRRDGGLKVVDFGLAKGSAIFGHDGGALDVVTTSPGMILGTPRYMSPEQTRGLPLDGRSDIFSLGIILFEMVTGRTPFPGKTAADTLAAILGKEPRPIAEFVKDPPPKLVSIIERMLKKDSEDRYRWMGAVLVDLEDLRIDLTIPTRRFTERSEIERARPWAFIAAGTLIAIMIAAGGWWYFAARGRGSGPSSSVLRNVPVASWSSVSAEAVTAASFSPDAKMVAFGSTKSGASEIWSKPVSGGEPIQVTKNGFYNQYPIWSPDGQELAFFSKRGDTLGIWKVVFTGGQESQLVSGVTPLARPLRWCSDKRLFYKDGAEIYVLDVASGERRQVTELGTAGLSPRAIGISADGDSFAIAVKENGEWKIKRRRFDAGPFVDVAASKDQIDAIAFDPDGTDLLYTGAVDGTFQIFRTNAGRDPEQLSSGSGDLSLQDVSSDGSKILYNTITETSDVWLLDLRTSAQSVVANDITEEYWADISSDGKAVVYEATEQPDRPFRGSIWVKTVGMENPVRISADGFLPIWSPDGQWIAFLRRTNAEISAWRVRPTGGDAQRVGDGSLISPSYISTPYLRTEIEPITWSPDGATLTYTAKADDGSAIWVASPAGAKRLTPDEGSGSKECCVAWLPDGQQLVYAIATATQRPRNYELWVSGPDGSDRRRFFSSSEHFKFMGIISGGREALIAQRVDPSEVATISASVDIRAVDISSGTSRRITLVNNTYYHNIQMSRDGSTIAYVSRASGVTSISIVRISSGGAERRVLTEQDPKVLISSLRFTPDGNSIAFGKQTRTNVISMLTN
jgi:serine/threonine protein kinase